MKRDFLALTDVTTAEVEHLVALASELKQNLKDREPTPLLAGKTLALLFHKPSLRTRTSFDLGMYQLGGHATDLQDKDVQIGVREPIQDFGRILSRYYDGIVMRTFGHDTIVELAQAATIPVINGLTDLLHPCQILAALLTLHEHFGRLAGLHIAYLGDGNNMANSWLLGAARMGLTLTIACPKAYAPEAGILAQAKQIAESTDAVIEIVDDPHQGVKGTDVVYTDVWTSMGQEDEAAVRQEIFRPYQINAALMAETASHAVVLHCLPAHRGEEITAEVLESPRCLAFDEAENRLHAQKALLVFLLAPEGKQP
ncbi:Ornithine carbamoyltransferase [Candidatus Entotheonellaceae bacterium PAL068K]